MRKCKKAPYWLCVIYFNVFSLVEAKIKIPKVPMIIENVTVRPIFFKAGCWANMRAPTPAQVEKKEMMTDEEYSKNSSFDFALKKKIP